MKKVLMVCLGNICRSPLAEELLKSKVDPKKVQVDSAGTGDYHVGDCPDHRSIAIAQKNGLDITHQIGRQFTTEDFKNFDYIYVMDNYNYKDVVRLAKNDKDTQKVSLVLDKIYPNENADVPDPYQGGEHGFVNVYQMLDQATDIIAKELE